MVIPLDQRPRSGPYSGINARSAKRFLTEQFRAAGLPFPEEDAQDLVLAATGLTPADMITRGTEFLSPEAFERVSDYAARRAAGEPVDHILGARDFYGRRFKITKDVLSPRADTEVLVREALACIKDIKAPRVLDLGTGSGAILITLMAEREDIQGVGVDLSPAAIKVATDNAAANDVNPIFLTGSWFAPVTGQFDLIISNPPYITSAAMETLETEVAAYDPALSLHGGESGLLAYRDILAKARDYLAPGGWLVFEIGYDQKSAVCAMMDAAGFEAVRCERDLGGQDRAVIGRNPA